MFVFVFVFLLLFLLLFAVAVAVAVAVVVAVAVAVAIVVVEWLYYSERIIIDKRAEPERFFVDFRWKNVCSVSRPMKFCLFSSKKR